MEVEAQALLIEGHTVPLGERHVRDPWTRSASRPSASAAGTHLAYRVASAARKTEAPDSPAVTGSQPPPTPNSTGVPGRSGATRTGLRATGSFMLPLGADRKAS